MALLNLTDISKYYVSGKNVVKGLDKINLSFEKGEFVAITGESGSGKTTLAHILGGILPYEDGELFFNNSPTSHFDSRDWENYRRDNISFISQNYGILEGATVLENILSALYLSGVNKEEALIKADEILKEVDLTDHKNKKAAKLSSGQKQRLSIVRALSKPSSILIADEPTGNLDSENSIKVIKLLKSASKERLVILITHEYEEAENYVTRHITIKEGKIASDIKTRDFDFKIIDKETKENKKEKQNLGLYFSLLQLKSRPVFSLLLFLFLTLTSFAFFSFLGTFIVNLDDNSTRIYDDSAFSNGSKERIVVVKDGNEVFTDDDYSEILNTEHVISIEKWGFAADIYNSYREDTDYKIHYSLDNVGSSLEPEYVKDKDINVLKSDSFVKTIPLFNKDIEFLIDGRLPENLYEVISADLNYPIGSSFQVYIRDDKTWGYNEYFTINVTVVGTTNYGTGLYFHNDMGIILNYNFTKKDFQFSIFAPYYENVSPSVGKEFHTDYKGRATYILPEERFTPKEELDENFKRPIYDDEFVPSATFVTLYGNRQLAGAYNESSYIEDTGLYGEFNALFPVNEVNESTLLEFAFVSENTFRKACPDKGSTQISLTIEDYAYTERVIEALMNKGYNAASPYQLGTTKQNSKLATERIETLSICIASLLAVIFLQALVLKALFNSENESYKLLANLGLSKKSASNSLLLQLLFVALSGEAAGFLAIFISSAAGFERITSMLHFLPVTYLLLLLLVHILSILFAFIFISHSLKKQVYPYTSQKDDLELI